MSNLSRLKQELQRREVPAMLLSDVASVQWATGFSGSFGLVLLKGDDGIFLTDSRYTVQAREEVKDLPSETFGSPVTGTEFLADHVAKMGIPRLGFEADKVIYAAYEEWRDKLSPTQLFGVKDLVGELRMVKSAAEVEKIRRACGLADACFAHVVRMIQPGVSEFDISLEIEFFIRRQGANLAFEPIVVSGHRSARPHGRASEKKLESGDFVTMDFGASVDGYNSDITRTVVVGEATDRHREVYGMVLEAQQAALDSMKPGIAAKDVDAISRQVLAQKDLAKYFGHGLGHGLGRLVHDSGRMNSGSTHTLAPGQVWTVEPGVYIEGFGGVRIEDDVVVTESGIDILTHSPKDLMILPA